MKIAFLLLFAGLMSQQLCAQFGDDPVPDRVIVSPRDTIRSLIPRYHTNAEMIVPYRKGTKWGVSDTLGNLIVPAIYDEVEYTSESFSSHSDMKDCHCVMPQEKHRYRGCLITIKGGKYGAVAKTGIILQPTHDRLTFSSEFFILEHQEEGPGKLFNLKGKLLSDSIHSIGELQYDSGMKDHYLFEATGDGINGVFLYDAINQKIVKWIIRDKWYFQMISCSQERNVAVYFVDGGRSMAYYHFHLEPKTLKPILKEISWKEYETVMGLDKLKSIPSWEAYDYEAKRDSLLTLEYSVIRQNGSAAIAKRLFNPFPVKKRMTGDTTLLHIAFDTLVVNSLRNPNGTSFEAGKTNHAGFDTLSKYLNYALYRNGKKWGVIAGNSVLDAEYDELQLVPSSGKVPCFLGSKTISGTRKWGIVSLSGTIVVPFEYDSLKNGSTSVISYKSGRYGVLTTDGTVVATPKYDKVSFHKQWKHWLVIEDKGKRSIYNGRQLVEPQFDFPFHNVFLVDIGGYELYKISDQGNNAIGYMSKSGVRFFSNTP